MREYRLTHGAVAAGKYPFGLWRGLLLVSILTILLIMGFERTAQAAPGDLDPSFGSNGKVVASVGEYDYAADAAVQSDGKLVVGGEASTDFGLARLNTNGTLDTSFASSGRLITRMDYSFNSRISDVDVQADGKIIAVGGSAGSQDGIWDYAVARYNPDGSVNLRQTGDYFPGHEYAHAVAVQSDGKMVIVGSFDNANGDRDWSVVRLHTSGSPDESFGSEGTVATTFGSTSDIAHDAAIQRDGKIIVAGESGGYLSLVRYNTDGTLDTSFDSDGKVMGPSGGANSLAIQDDDKIIVGGNFDGLPLARYNPDGSLDSSFQVHRTAGLASGLALMDDGKIVVSKEVLGSSGYDFAAAMYNPDGSLVSNFGNKGEIVTNFGASDRSTGVAVQLKDRVVLGGYTYVNGQPDFAVARYYGDTTSPNITISSGPSGTVESGSASFTFSSSESYSRFECSLNSVFFDPCSSPKNYTNLKNGSYTFQVRAIDVVGNVSTTLSRAWNVDAPVPTTTISSGPSGIVGSGSANFIFSSSEEGSTFQCSLDGAAFSTCTSPKGFTDLTNGTHTFEVQAINPADAAGNVGPKASRTWTVDSTLPNATITSGPSGTVKSTSASFDFSSEGASFQCSLDGGAYEECQSPRSYFDLANGTHTFKVKATDVPGRTTPATRTWTVDTIAPNTTITSGPSGTVKSNSASFAFSSEDEAKLQCKFDSEVDFSDCASPKSFTDLANGSHTFQVRAIDVARNVGTVTSRTWTVDTTLPNTTITSGPSGTVKTNSASFAFSSNEAGSSFRCSLDGAAFSTCTSPKGFTNLTNGTHTVEVQAIDPAGNIGPATNRSWTVDTVLPTVSGMSPKNASISTDVTPTIKATVRDNLTNLQKANMKLYVNGVLISPTKYSYSASTDVLTYNSPKIAKGKKTIRIVATDAAKNVRSTSWYFTIKSAFQNRYSGCVGGWEHARNEGILAEICTPLLVTRLSPTGF